MEIPRGSIAYPEDAKYVIERFAAEKAIKEQVSKDN